MTKKEYNEIKRLLESGMKPEDITYLVKTRYGEICKIAEKINPSVLGQAGKP